MKYTSLFCAAVAAMGMQAFAVPTEVASDDFEDYDLAGLDAVEVKTINDFAGNGWTVVGEDQSAIVTTHFDQGGQALKLNTNGETLTLTAATTKDYTATVSMKVEMVASDTMVDMTGDDTTQTALFLYKPDENAEAGTLMAFSNDSAGGTNLWVALTDANFTALNDKDIADISIVINYANEEATYTVNGTTFAAIPLANPLAAAGHKLNSVAFRGTGFVDDLFVGAEQTGTFATFIYELAGEDPATYSKNIEDFTMDDELPAKTGYTPFAALYERANGEDTKLADLQLDANNGWTVDETTYNFVEGGTYVIKADYELKSVTITIVDGDNNDALVATVTDKKWFESFTWTAPNGGTFEGYTIGEDEFYDATVSIASLEADTYTVVLNGYVAGAAGKTWTTADVVANSFSWTSYDPAAGTATFTCTLNGVPAQGDTFGSFTVTTATVFGGAETDQAVTIVPDLTALPTLTGTVSGLPTGGNGLFLLGVKDAAAPSAGE